MRREKEEMVTETGMVMVKEKQICKVDFQTFIC